MYEYQLAHDLGYDGEPHAKLNYFDKVDDLNAFCCAHASKDSQEVWCE